MGRGYEGTREDAMERGDRLWYRLLFSTGAKEYFRHGLIYPVTKREAIGRGFGVLVQKTGTYASFQPVPTAVFLVVHVCPNSQVQLHPSRNRLPCTTKAPFKIKRDAGTDVVVSWKS